MRSGNFVLPHVSFPTLEILLKVYYLAYRDGLRSISTKDLSAYSKKSPNKKMHITIQEASGCVSLLHSGGVIEKTEDKNKYNLTELGITLGRAIKDYTVGQASECWGKVVENSDYLRDVFYNYIKKVGIFRQEDLQREIVFRLGREPKSNALRGALTIIDILEKADYIIKRTEGYETQVLSNEKKFLPKYINGDRISSLRMIKSSRWDLKKLIKICEEINHCYENEHYYSVGILTRVMIDHIPPIFNFRTFTEFSSSYSNGTKSFRENMEFLDKSARKVADQHIHSHIKNKEEPLNSTQISFSPALDILLLEIISVLNKQAG